MPAAPQIEPLSQMCDVYAGSEGEPSVECFLRRRSLRKFCAFSRFFLLDGTRTPEVFGALRRFSAGTHFRNGKEGEQGGEVGSASEADDGHGARSLPQARPPARPRNGSLAPPASAATRPSFQHFGNAIGLRPRPGAAGVIVSRPDQEELARVTTTDTHRGEVSLRPARKQSEPSQLRRVVCLSRNRQS